jgi:hypothetical protein
VAAKSTSEAIMKETTPLPAAHLIRLLLDLDSQFMSGRPSTFARAIVTVAKLCAHAEGSLRSGLLDGWQDVDISQIHESRP